MLKLDSNGEIEWQKTYGGNKYDYAWSIQQTSDGGYIVAGSTYTFGAGESDIWVLKLDSNGNVSWQRTYGGNDYDYAWSIQQTSDGGYIVTGSTESFGAGGTDVWVLKLDGNGNVSWQKTYGGNDYDYAYSIQQTLDGGYTVAGSTRSFGSDPTSVYVLKLDSNGEIPGCDSIDYSNAIVNETSVLPQDTNAVITSTSAIVTSPTINPQNTSAEISIVCCYEDDDYDCDSIPDVEDNCPETPNGPNLGTCIYGWSEMVTCTTDDACGADGICSTNQEDEGDGVGDVCDNCPNDYNPDQRDFDGDCIGDVCDNCQQTPNGLNLGTCYSWSAMESATTCYNDGDCETGESCQKNQEDYDGDELGDVCDNCPNTPNQDQLDQYPPQGNNIGDACDCEADFDCNGNVGSLDVTSFLWDFGRSEYYDPCTNDRWCYGDFDCNRAVDADDVSKFLEDFGRGQYFNPCPTCEVGDWCMYP